MTRPAQTVDMRKEAFVGRLLGSAARGVAGMGGRGLGFVADTFTSNPLGAGMSTLMAIPTLASIQNPLKDPETLARGYSTRRLLAQQNPELAMKLSSSVLSQTDFEASLKIYGQLEKSASSFGDLARDLSKALSMHGRVGHLGDEVTRTMEQARNAGRAAREATKFPDELASLKQQLRLNEERAKREAEQLALARKKIEVESDKLKLETRKLDQDTAYKGRQEARDVARHEKEMKRWTFGQLLGAGMGLGAAATVVGAGSSAMGHAAGMAQEKLRGMGSDKRYKDMLRVEPSLKDDPRSKAYFKILDRASPYMAGEPYLAAATVQQMISTPSLSGDKGVPSIRPEMLSQILKAEQARQETRFPFLNKRENSLRDIATLGG